jgi:hypothetical protein
VETDDFASVLPSTSEPAFCPALRRYPLEAAFSINKSGERGWHHGDYVPHNKAIMSVMRAFHLISFHF